MTLLEAIDARSSRRAYRDHALPPEAAFELQAAIGAANAEPGIAIRLVDDNRSAFSKLSKTYGLFSGVRSFIVLAGAAGTPDLLVRLGYHGERVALEAVRLGLGTCWVGGSFDRADQAVAPGPGEDVAGVITVGVVANAKTAKERLITTLTRGRRRQAAEFFEADSPPPDWFLRGVEAALKAPSAMNRKPVRFTWNNGKAGIRSLHDDRAGQLDLGIAMAHFEIAAGCLPERD